MSEIFFEKYDAAVVFRSGYSSSAGLEPLRIKQGDEKMFFYMPENFKKKYED
ncbi:hypothetical protein [Lebetimonas sp. JH292]|uniref:hypothetical protein n=1 Tax=Lebetimonas sp. JH292 TaxID=990068 RepID=UPI0004B7D423|nr:hypothetical protein [Lebetimonas sp. JH292]